MRKWGFRNACWPDFYRCWRLRSCRGRDPGEGVVRRAVCHRTKSQHGTGGFHSADLSAPGCPHPWATASRTEPKVSRQALPSQGIFSCLRDLKRIGQKERVRRTTNERTDELLVGACLCVLCLRVFDKSKVHSIELSICTTDPRYKNMLVEIFLSFYS